MKSKSVDFGHASYDKQNHNRTFDFVNLYKSASATSDSVNGINKPTNNNETANGKVKANKSEKWGNKRKKEKRESIDVSHITIEGPGLNSSVGGSTPLDESKVTSTPLGARQRQAKASKVKSIMKVPAVTDEAMDGTNLGISPNKSKKRNKSVSFMLEENEEVMIKKTKSNDPTGNTKIDSTLPKIKRQFKKVKKNKLAEKENNLHGSLGDTDIPKENKKSIKNVKEDTLETPIVSTGETTSENETKKKKKKAKKTKAENSAESKDSTAAESTSQDLPERVKKPKKKKHQEKILSEADNDEPAAKSRKKNDNPDVVAELENLSIGDNAHTLTNLLDDMTVVDKGKRKKLKQFNKNKKPKVAASEDAEKPDVVKEKVKWQRRKWNKDGKGEGKECCLGTTVIVENLPLSLLFSYKKVLAEHFVKYGLVRSVGIAEVYPTEVSKPVFTTTINFDSDAAATQALEEDGTKFEGSRIQVKQPLPPTETTVVVRSYGALTQQFISSTFNGAGRIRNIRCPVKGKHAMGTFFIEFDGPESVDRALKMATNIKIGEKKIYISKFEIRTKKAKIGKTQDNEGSDADQSEGS